MVGSEKRMSVTLAVIAALLFCGCSIEAFAVSPGSSLAWKGTSLTSLDAKKKLTSQDIINKARQASGLPVEEEEEAPKIFDEDLLEDMKESLLLLEKRVKEGPGCLSAEEVTSLAERMDRISAEMKSFANLEVETVEEPAAVPSQLSTEERWGMSASRSPTTVSPSSANPDISQDEGPEYTGSGGLGLARGTRNTYAIPGMEEMSSEEYRAALQKSVLDAQAERRAARRQIVGNRAAHDYLSTLGYGGASDSLSRGKNYKKEEESS